MNSKPVKTFLKVIYFLWGAYSLLLVTLSTLSDLIKVLGEGYKIENIFWFFGMIPAVFYVVYLISLKAKKSVFLKKLSGILGILSFLIFVIAFQTSGFNWALLIVALFSVSVFVKVNFSKTHAKKEVKETKVEDSKTDSKALEPKFLIIMLVIVLLILAFLYGRSSALENAKKAEVKEVSTTASEPTLTNTPSPTISPIPKKNTNTVNNSSLIDCIGPDGKEFKTSETECKKLNEAWGKTTDYYVDCRIHANCGGGTKRMKKSECDSSICCSLRDGTAVLLPSKNACDNYYSTGNNSNQNNIPSYPPCTIYYPALGTSQTYYYTSPEQCQEWKNQINTTTTKTIPTTAPIIYPTTKPYATPTPSVSKDEAKSKCDIEAKSALGDGSNGADKVAAMVYCLCMQSYGYNVVCPY